MQNIYIYIIYLLHCENSCSLISTHPSKPLSESGPSKLKGLVSGSIVVFSSLAWGLWVGVWVDRCFFLSRVGSVTFQL